MSIYLGTDVDIKLMKVDRTLFELIPADCMYYTLEKYVENLRKNDGKFVPEPKSEEWISRSGVKIPKGKKHRALIAQSTSFYLLDPEYYSGHLKYLENTDNNEIKLWKLPSNPLIELSRNLLFGEHVEHLYEVGDGNYSGMGRKFIDEGKGIESPSVMDLFSKIHINEYKRQARANFVYKKMSEILCGKMKEIHDEIVAAHPPDRVLYENLLDYCLIMEGYQLNLSIKKKWRQKHLSKWTHKVVNYLADKAITLIANGGLVDLYPKIVRDIDLNITLHDSPFFPSETYYMYIHTIWRDYFFIFLANAALEYNTIHRHNGKSFFRYISTVKIPIIPIMEQVRCSERYISIFKEKTFICRKIASFDSLYEQVRLVEKMEEAGFGDRIKQWKAEIAQELNSAENNADNTPVRNLYSFEQLKRDRDFMINSDNEDDV